MGGEWEAERRNIGGRWETHRKQRGGKWEEKKSLIHPKKPYQNGQYDKC